MPQDHQDEGEPTTADAVTPAARATATALPAASVEGAAGRPLPARRRGTGTAHGPEDGPDGATDASAPAVPPASFLADTGMPAAAPPRTGTVARAGTATRTSPTAPPEEPADGRDALTWLAGLTGLDAPDRLVGLDAPDAPDALAGLTGLDAPAGCEGPGPDALDRLAGLTVLHVAQPADGGVARVVTDLVRAQVLRGARVVLACPPGGGLGPDAAAVGADVVRWTAGRSPGRSLAAEVRALARVVRAVRPDLLHLHSSKAGLAGRLAVRGRLPTVFQPHAWSYDAVSGPAARAALGWERAAARWAHHVLCVSAAERDAGVRQGIRGAWAVVPNGVDTVRFRPPARRGAVRAALPAPAGVGLGDATPLVVCVGRLCRQKGQDVLLRAWPEVTGRLPDARLVLVGDGPDRARLARQAPPGVVLAGAATDPLPWYQAADVVVQPSRWEGMALAPLEAMACGRPVVTSDVSGARESLPAADADAHLVPPDDPAALAAALLRLLADPAARAAAGLRAREHVRARHDVRAATAAVGALYADLLPRPARAVPEAASR